MKYNFDFKEGPSKVDFRFKDSDVNRIVVKAHEDGTVRLMIYDGTGGQKDDLLIQAVMCNQAAVEFGSQIAAIARDNE